MNDLKNLCDNSSTHILTGEQIEKFQHDGVLVVDNILTDDELDSSNYVLYLQGLLYLYHTGGALGAGLLLQNPVHRLWEYCQRLRSHHAETLQFVLLWGWVLKSCHIDSWDHSLSQLVWNVVFNVIEEVGWCLSSVDFSALLLRVQNVWRLQKRFWPHFTLPSKQVEYSRSGVLFDCMLDA